MGDVTSTCCNSSTHLQQANLTRQFPPSVSEQVVLHHEPFQQAPRNIRQTFLIASKTSYFNSQMQKLNVEYDSQIFNGQNIITVTRKNKNSSTNLFDFLSGEYSIYLKSLSSQNQLSVTEQIFSGLFLVYFPNKQYFLGIIKNNIPNYGIFIFKTSCYYIGHIRDLQAQGQGRYENKENGYCYEGYWSKNLQHGKGKQVYENGDIFEGQFMYGSKFGQGVYSFHDGKKYQGYFYNGHSDGIGKLTVGKKQWYKGQWRLGSIQGKGQYHYENGDVYHGEFYNGVKNGKGKYVFAAGYEYEGEWVEGKMHGQGVIRQGYDQIEGQQDQGVKIR